MKAGITEWDAALAEKDIKDLEEYLDEFDSPEYAEKINSLRQYVRLNKYNMSADDWYSEYYETTSGDSEGVTQCRATYHVLFQLEALRWLCENLKMEAVGSL